jgi:hypothetical protein
MTTTTAPNGKIDVDSCVIESGRNMATGVKYEINVKKMIQKKPFLLFL